MIRSMTKVSRYQIDGCQAKVAANHWPVETFIMRAQELTFPDNYFDFSFTNFVVADLDDPKIVAHHLFRTLKPGGRAVVCTFAFRPHDDAMKAAHLATRGHSAKLGLAYDPGWLKQETLRAFLVAGGFEKSKISISTCDVFEKLKDLRWWMTALWGYIGQRDIGWTLEDEEKWDEAVDILVETMAKSPGVMKTDDGEALVKFVVNVSIATK